MNADRNAARQRRRRNGRIRLAAVALIGAGLVACVVVGFLPGHAAPWRTAASSGTVERATGHAEAAPADAASSPRPARTPTAGRGGSASPSDASPTPHPADTRASAPAGAPLAGRIRPGVTYRGVATSYAAGAGDGACLFGPTSDLMIAAMNYTDYETAKACGAYIRVHAANGASVTVRITNECPLPCAPGQLDLSPQAFAALADPSLGRIPITWQLLSPAVPGPLSLRYKTGSTRWWCALQVIGHRNPVALLEVRTPGGWRQLPRTDYNYFVSADGTGCGGAIRITDIYGQRLVLDRIALLPDVVQRTSSQFAQH